MTLTIRVPAALWLSSNRSVTNHAHRARIIRDLHTLTTHAARGHEPITGPVIAAWEVRYPKGTSRVGRHASASNAQPTTKAILDGITGPGRILTDDGSEIVIAEHYRRGTNLTERGWHEIQLHLISQAVPF